MRSRFAVWALCGALVFSPVCPGQDHTQAPPEECPQAIVENAPAPPGTPNRITQWVVGGSLLCSVAAGSYVACQVLQTNHDLRTAFYGALIALGVQQALTAGRCFVGPQMDWLDMAMKKLGYAVNHTAFSWLLGRSPRTHPLGCSHSPNHNIDINARLSLQQQQTAQKIGSVLTHLDWLGLRLPELLKRGEVAEAASQFVSTVVLMSYADQEIIVRTAAPHIDNMTQQLILLGAQGYLFDKLAPIFQADPELLKRFREQVEAKLEEAHAQAPMAFYAYRAGIQIVVNDWLASALKRAIGSEFTVQIPE